MSKINKSILSVAIVTLLVITALGISYAYFTANLTGGESASTLLVSAGRMLITFSGGNDIEINNAYPKDEAWATKQFSVTGTNTTALDMKYKLSLVVTNNGYSNNALAYSLNGINPKNNGSVVPTKTKESIATGPSSIEIGEGFFSNADNISHTYNLQIFFPNTSSNQNVNQGKSFAAYVGIEDVK